jgi:predicted nuclease of predicted toxin-antitoxin system
MRFLANENVPGPVVAALREHGHDVFWVKESMRGADDPIVLARAQTERRVVVTLDKDFGELAFRSRLPAQSGVILIRLDWKDPETDNQIATAALLSREDWADNFAVIERDRIRIRPLPNSTRSLPKNDGARAAGDSSE